MKRTYTDLERAEAQGLAAAIGPVKAAEKLGIPRRTVASWMHMPAASPIIAAAEQDIANALRHAHAKALSAVMDGLNDPKARLSDRARALEVLGEQLALAEGRATENVNLHTNGSVQWRSVPDQAPLNDEERIELRDWLDQLDDEQVEQWANEMRERDTDEGELMRGMAPTIRDSAYLLHGTSSHFEDVDE